MKINPQVLRWTAPTERTDGSPIPGPLDYELGSVIDDEFVPQFVVVGSLQDGQYVAPLADMAFDDGAHTIALRATEQATGLTSDWSNAVSFEIVSAAPRPPQAVAVE